MYDFLDEQLKQHFSVVTTYLESPEKTILRLRHNQAKADFIMRKFIGDDTCYRKLLPIKSPYLPEIFEVATKDSAEVCQATPEPGIDDTAKSVLVLEEFIEGDSLSKMLEDSLFTEKETRAIAMDVCRALYVLHSLDIVHRDIKPENIILRGAKAVLLDFDAARIRKDEDTTATDTHALGTTGYAAPEQYGISQTDGRADIFALGVTMNLLRTGKHPSQELAPGRLGRVISKCINVQPSKRYQSVTELMEVLAI